MEILPSQLTLSDLLNVLPSEGPLNHPRCWEGPSQPTLIDYFIPYLVSSNNKHPLLLHQFLFHWKGRSSQREVYQVPTTTSTNLPVTLPSPPSLWTNCLFFVKANPSLVHRFPSPLAGPAIQFRRPSAG